MDGKRNEIFIHTLHFYVSIKHDLKVKILVKARFGFPINKFFYLESNSKNQFKDINELERNWFLIHILYSDVLIRNLEYILK